MMRGTLKGFARVLLCTLCVSAAGLSFGNRGYPAGGMRAAAGELSAGELSTGALSTGTLSAGEPSTGALSAGEQSAGTLYTGTPSAGGMSTGEPAGDMAEFGSNSEWRNGRWVGGSYVNGEGLVLASIESADQAKLPKLKRLRKKNILYIGASRTRCTKQAVKDPDVAFCSCGGIGFRWFFQTIRFNKAVHQPAYLVIRAFLKLHPRGCVIIDMGGNDPHNIEAYIGFYRDLLNRYKRARIWFHGILPREIGTASNAERREFNLRLEREFPGHVINLFDQVYAMPDFHTVDGTHYSKELSRVIYQMTMDAIGRDVNVNLKNGKVCVQDPIVKDTEQNTEKEEKSTKEKAAKGKTAKTQSAKAKTTKTTEDKTTKTKTAKDKTAEGNTTKDKTTEDKTTEDKTTKD